MKDSIPRNFVVAAFCAVVLLAEVHTKTAATEPAQLARLTTELSPQPLRTWVDVTGTRKASATLIEFRAENQLVRLKKPDGSMASAFLHNLSEADRSYVERFKAETELAARYALVSQARKSSGTPRFAHLQAPASVRPRSSANPYTGFIYTGRRGTQAIDVTAKNGKALYRHIDDYADATDLHQMWEDSHYYYFREVGKPGWYWQLAKRPTYECCGCYWYLIGYRVTYVQDVGPNPPRIEFRYFARRQDQRNRLLFGDCYCRRRSDFNVNLK